MSGKIEAMNDISTTAGQTERASQAVLDHPAVRAVTADLAAIGLAPAITTFTIAARTAAIAAEALGIDIAQIANSLIFCADNEPLLVMTSGAHRVDTLKLANLLGKQAIAPASAQFVREHAAQTIGGVAPVGHPAPIETIIDTSLARYDIVWAAAGHPNSVFPTTYEQLLNMTHGTAADVA